MADQLIFRPVTVNGRELIFRTPNTIQVALLHRLSKVMDSAAKTMDAWAEANKKDPGVEPDDMFKNASKQGMEAMGKVLDLFASLVGPDVNEWLTDQMLTGQISDEDLIRILDEITPKEESPKAPAPKSRARRTT